jgi:exoribonuclease II
VAWASGTTPAYARGSDELASAMRDFEIAYETYAEFQRNMERYWCLMYLQQHAIKQISAHVLRESLVRLVGLPLVCRVPSLPNLAPGSEVQIEVVDVDPWELSVNCVFKHKGSA